MADPTKSIRIACSTKDHLPLESLKEFQGDLKVLMVDKFDQLKKLILDTGFAFPILVWKSPEGKNCIIGGHQRVAVLRKLKKEGYEIPELPVVFIEAADYKAAKERVLQDIAQYGKVGYQGLYEFMHEAQIGMDEMMKSYTIPEVNLTDFARGFFEDDPSKLGVVTDPNEEWKGMPEFNQQDKTSFRHIIVHFAKQEDVEKFFAKIEMSCTDETKSIWYPPQERMDTKNRLYSDDENAPATVSPLHPQ